MVAQRDEKGRFAKGNPGGPGRPTRETEQYFIELFRDCVSDDDFRAVVDALVRAAKRGNTSAAKMILDYLMGPPKQKAEVSGEAGGPITFVIKERGAIE